MDKRFTNEKPVRFNEKKQAYEVLVGGARWRIAEEITCDNCGRRVYKETVEVKKFDLHFCSLSCSASRRNHKMWLKRGTGTVAKWCTICGSRFLVKASHYNRRTTCGNPACASANRSLKSSAYQRTVREASRDRA